MDSLILLLAQWHNFPNGEKQRQAGKKYEKKIWMESN